MPDEHVRRAPVSVEFDDRIDREIAAVHAPPSDSASRWKLENRGAMESWGTWMAEHGLPLARYRPF